MRKRGLLLGLVMVLAAGPVAAQVCLGYPGGRGQSSVGALIGLQSHLTQLGATYAVHSPTDIVLDAAGTFDHYSTDIDRSGTNGFSLAGRLGLELHSTALPPSLSLCPHIGVGIRHVSDLNAVTVPIGFGIGTSIPLLPAGRYTAGGRARPPRGGNALIVYATPAYFYEHVSVDRVSGSNSSIGTELGAHFVLGGPYIGASVLLRSGGANTVLHLNAGIPLGR